MSYQVDYAKSGRAKCKACKQPIEQGFLRLGKMTDAGQYQQVCWHHVACVARQRACRDLEVTQFKGWEELKEEDKEAVRESFAQASKGGNKRKQTVLDPKTGEAKAEPGTSRRQPLLLEPPIEKKQKNAPTNNTRDFNTIVDEAESAFNAALHNKSTKSSSSPGYNKKKGLTADQNAQYLAFCDLFDEKKTDELRDLLRQNHSRVSGNKKVLVERCAEGKLLGVLPLCKSCNKGYIHLDWKKKKYVCEGHMEHGRKEDCEGEVDQEDVVRREWVED